MVNTCVSPATRYRHVPFTALLGEVNRIQEEFARHFGKPVASGPAINLWSDANEFHAETDVPGVDPATLEITVTDGSELTIKGERKSVEPDGASWLRQERNAGAFIRTLTLPNLVDADAVEARCENGVLKLTLPKSAAAKPRRIAVKS